MDAILSCSSSGDPRLGLGAAAKVRLSHVIHFKRHQANVTGYRSLKSTPLNHTPSGQRLSRQQHTPTPTDHNIISMSCAHEHAEAGGHGGAGDHSGHSHEVPLGDGPQDSLYLQIDVPHVVAMNAVGGADAGQRVIKWVVPPLPASLVGLGTLCSLGSC